MASFLYNIFIFHFISGVHHLWLLANIFQYLYPTKNLWSVTESIFYTGPTKNLKFGCNLWVETSLLYLVATICTPHSIPTSLPVPWMLTVLEFFFSLIRNKLLVWCKSAKKNLCHSTPASSNLVSLTGGNRP